MHHTLELLVFTILVAVGGSVYMLVDQMYNAMHIDPRHLQPLEMNKETM